MPGITYVNKGVKKLWKNVWNIFKKDSTLYWEFNGQYLKKI